MARASKVVACMFCEQVPCECNKPKKKAPVPRKKQQASAPVDKPTPPSPASKPDVRAAMKARASRTPASPLEPPPPPTPKEEAVVEMSEDEALFRQAIRAVGELLHPVERRKYSSILTDEPLPRERAIAWKARRNVQEASGVR